MNTLNFRNRQEKDKEKCGRQWGAQEYSMEQAGWKVKDEMMMVDKRKIGTQRGEQWKSKKTELIAAQHHLDTKELTAERWGKI